MNNLNGFHADFIWFRSFVKEQRFYGAPYVSWLFDRDVVRCPGMPHMLDPRPAANDP